MAFIRTKRVGEREYHQLVENYRESGTGRHRQRVLAHLGQHETLEDAIGAAREKYLSTRYDAIEDAEYQEQRIRQKYAEFLERYHGGEIPTVQEVEERGQLFPAPYTDEVESEFYGITFYKRQVVEVPEEVEEYRRALGHVRESHNYRTKEPEVTRYGSWYVYGGLSSFLDYYLRPYESRKRTAERQRHAVLSRRARLEKLEAVAARGD